MRENDLTPFFMSETESFHIGEIIRQSLQRQQRSAAWLARQLCTDVSNGPKILKQQHLHAELLLKISHVLHEDFFAYYSDFYQKKE